MENPVTKQEGNLPLPVTREEAYLYNIAMNGGISDEKYNELIAQIEEGIGAFTEDTEVIVARGGEVNLDTRLNKFDAQLDEKADERETTQRNFLELKKRHMYTQGDNEFEITGLKNVSFYFPLSKTEKAKARFQRDVNDDFIKMREMSIIGQETVESALIKQNQDSINPGNGMVAPASTGNSYTSAVGVTITKVFEGTQIFFNHYADARGGVWKCTIDGTVVANISTHINAVTPNELIDAATATYRRKIAEGLSDTSHTLIMEFVGDDPINSPEDGASRGWIKTQSVPPTANQVYTSFEFNTKSLVPVTTDMLHNQSNKEFAIRIKKTGTSDAVHWFPEHSGVGTAYLGSTGSQRLIVDGEEISLLEAKDLAPFKEAQLIQTLEISHPQQPSTLAKLYCVSTITREKVSMITTVEWLQDVTIEKGYVNMLTVNSDFGNQIITSLGKTVVSPPEDNAITNFLEDDRSNGYAAVSLNPDYKDYMVAVQIPTSYESLRKYDSTRRYNATTAGATWLHHRTADKLLKIYPQVFDLNHTVSAGEKYTFEGEYFVAKIPNIASMLVGASEQ